MVQAQRLSKRQRIERAIAFALDRRWDLAAAENRGLLHDDPNDVETANRLGKALTETGDIDGAAEAYEHALRIDSTNAIARKNLARLEELKGSGKRPARPKKAAARAARNAPAAAPLRVYSLIEESARSAEFTLQQPNAQALKRLSVGDVAQLEPSERGVTVTTESGAALGTIDVRAGLRLKRMIAGGNRYAVVIRQVADGTAVVHIREVHTDPSLAGQASFIAPPAARRRTPRAYVKASIVDRGRDTEDADEEEESGRETEEQDRGTGFVEAAEAGDDDEVDLGIEDADDDNDVGEEPDEADEPED